jgi:hypothetical protein
MYFPGRYRDNAARAGYVCDAFITDLLRAIVDDGNHQPVVVVARKLVIPELAVQDLESWKLRDCPALWCQPRTQRDFCPRYRPGVIPNSRRNARVKLACDEKFSASVICASG